MIDRRIRPLVRQAKISYERWWHAWFPQRLYCLQYDSGVWRHEQRDRGGKAARRALVSYITEPFTLAPGDPANTRFSNIGIARTMVRVLNDLGYAVDVVNFDDRRFTPRRHYDLFIGHGGINFQQIVEALSPPNRKIYFSTGRYWRVHNAAEIARFEALFKRRSVRLKPDRLITDAEEWANRHADAIICLGNALVKEDYRDFPHVYNLNNAAYADDHYERMSKDFDAGRKNFLFYAGPGNVHKGLDLILEAFAQSNAQLYICQRIDADFARVYRHELSLPNVHVEGLVPARGQRFYELIERCNVFISASCSEGSQGAAIECMHQGLIPILSRECTIDGGDYNIILNECTVAEIARVITDVSMRPVEWHQQMSRRIQEAAQADFSEQAFYENLSHLLS